MLMAILAFVFGVLLFLMSAAALALEPAAHAPGVWRLAWLALAGLHALAGFFALGGALAWAQARWSHVMASAAGSACATIVAAGVAAHLAARVHLQLSPHAATVIVFATLVAGAMGVVLTASSSQNDTA